MAVPSSRDILRSVKKPTAAQIYSRVTGKAPPPPPAPIKGPLPLGKRLPIATVPKPAALTPISFNDIAPPNRTANTTPARTERGTKEVIKDTAKWLNPVRPIEVSPAFSRQGETKKLPFGGGLVSIAHDVAARVAEGAINTPLRILADVKALRSRKPLSEASVELPFDSSRLDKTKPAGSNRTPGIGANLIKEFERLETERPGKTKSNIALATFNGPVTDFLNLTFVGGFADDAARGALKATRFNPQTQRALQQYGMEGTTLQGEDFTREFTRRFNQKARELIEKEDFASLDELGRATNAIVTALRGEGIPQLTKLGRMVQDGARFIAQDTRTGIRTKLDRPVTAELAPERRVEALPGMVEEPGQAPAMGLSTRRMRRVGGEDAPEPPKVEVEPFQGFQTLTTKLLERLTGKTVVSKQFIQDLTNNPDLKQAERELVRKVLEEEEGDTVNVNDFANRVQSELLPLESSDLDAIPRYEGITLPDELRGPVANYEERVYQSPIKTTAGDVHFRDESGEVGSPEGYFAHSRIEDLPVGGNPVKEADMMNMTGDQLRDYYKAQEAPGKIRRVIEIQSDLFQKGRLEGETSVYALARSATPDQVKQMKQWEKEGLPNAEINERLKTMREESIKSLEPYRNIWYERVIREEVKRAALDDKTKLQFPTGETAMKIEGLGSDDVWHLVDDEDEAFLTPENLKKGVEIARENDEIWIITEVLDGGKFNAAPKRMFENGYRILEDKGLFKVRLKGNAPAAILGEFETKKGAQKFIEEQNLRDLEEYSEQYDISGNLNTENPIYRFYEKEVGRYLTRKYGAKRVTDDQGVEWYEVDIKPDMKNAPVEAFGIAGGVQEDEDGGISFNPIYAALGIAGGRALGRNFKGLSKEKVASISKLKDADSVHAALVAEGVTKEIADELTPNILKAENEEEVARVILNKVDEIKGQSTYLPTEEESFEIAAKGQANWDPALRISTKELEKVDDDLSAVFADLKGITADDLKQTFTEEDLEHARMAYEYAADALTDHPGRALMKYVNPSGYLPEVKRNTKPTTSKTGKQLKDARGEWERKGDIIFQEMFGQERTLSGDVHLAQEWVDDYRQARKTVEEYQQSFRRIRNTIRLHKQRNEFVESAKRVLASAAAKDLKAIRGLVESARKQGFLEGTKKSRTELKDMIARLKSRRTQITAIKKRYNLTDSQMAKIRGPRDPRFMDTADFDTYLKDVETKAALQHEKNTERIIIDALINERELKKAENLQRALQFPSPKDMTLEQLREFSDALAKTEPGNTFLGPRMIQTAVNTELGNVRTVEEAQKKILEQTGMPYADPVEGAKTDRWLRDPTLAARDPLRKLFITEFAAKEADMLTKKYALQKELDRLAGAARKSRRKKDAELASSGKIKRTARGRLFGRLTPQDKYVVEWLQPFKTSYDNAGKKNIEQVPELRKVAEANMTPEELEYAQFLEKFFARYYNLSHQEALERWTLLGVKHSNYRNMYFAHMNRSFIERWRDDGFRKAMAIAWGRNVADTKIDFNAYGDRGEVLGMEKWLNRSMTREGEGVNRETGEVFYTQNAAKVALAYFHAFERKLILDSMIPKIKLLEFLMGKRFLGPKSITAPEGTEQIGSLLRRHTNEWINNKKGQRIEMVYQQGDRAEAIVDTARLFIAIQHLGLNILAQVISGIGGEALNLAGRGLKGTAVGHKRALTKQGRAIAREYQGAIGETPWRELANSANDAGDTLRGGLFYIFGDLAFRSRRQFFLSLLTKEEFETGKISSKRLGEVKLELGKWHMLPEFRSVAGATSAVKAAGMYTEWALPTVQNLHFVVIPRMRALLRRTPKEEWKKVVESDEFKTLFRTLITGSALAAIAYLTLNPDEDDRSNLGYMRRKAAQEISSTIQAITLWGIPTPFAIMNGYVESLSGAVKMLLTAERYETAGPGHAEGDLKGPEALKKALIPRGIRQWLPEPETPLKTEKEIAEEILAELRAGTLDEKAAEKKLDSELEKVRKAQEKRRFELEPKEYAEDLLKRLKAGSITEREANKELDRYMENKEKYAPESFESSSDADFINKIGIAAKALGTDPVTLFQAIFTDEKIRRMDNGEIILHRGKTADDNEQRDWSIKKRKEFGASDGLILDHIVPLQLGGDNSNNNLKLVAESEWKRYSPVENYLGMALRNKRIGATEAQRLIRAFKAGELTDEEVYAAVDS